MSLRGLIRRQMGRSRWRCVDLQSYIAQTYKVDYHLRSIGKLLRRLGLSHVSARPVHPGSDVAAQESFKKIFAAKADAVLPAYAEAKPLRLRAGRPAHARGRPLEIWVQDEARVGETRHADLRLGRERQTPARPA